MWPQCLTAKGNVATVINMSNTATAELKAARAVLEEDFENAYNPDAFPGSRAYNASRRAEKALEAFDAANPGVLEAVREDNANKGSHYQRAIRGED